MGWLGFFPFAYFTKVYIIDYNFDRIERGNEIRHEEIKQLIKSLNKK